MNHFELRVYDGQLDKFIRTVHVVILFPIVERMN